MWLYAKPGDRDQLGIREARKIGEMVGHITRFRAERPEAAEQFIDVKYGELVSDPLAVVQRIYERLDIRLTGQTVERMRRLASNRSRYRRSRLKPDSYRSRTYGESNIHQFQDYCSRFGISCPNSEPR
jgi:hypothetical protein